MIEFALLTSKIDALEDYDVCITNILGAYIYVDVDERLPVRLEKEMYEVLGRVTYELY